MERFRRCLAAALDVATTAFIGLLAGAVVAAVANFLGGSPTRMLITLVAGATIGAVTGVVRAVRRGGPRERRTVPLLHHLAPDDVPGAGDDRPPVRLECHLPGGLQGRVSGDEWRF